MKQMRRIGVTLVFAAILAFSGAQGADAYRLEKMDNVIVRGDFDMGPTSFAVEGKPGETITKTIQLTNLKGYEQIFQIVTEDFEGSADDPDKTVVLQGEGSGKYSAKGWITPDINEFTLLHGDRMHFDVSIKIPLDADAGDHYATVLAISEPKVVPDEVIDKSQPNVKITSRVGVLFFIRVKGPITEEGSLELFKSNGTFFTQKNPEVTFRSVFRNKGTVRLQPQGTIEIKNQFGKVVGTLEVKPYNVLRESVRALEQKWKTEKFYLGRYTATLKLYKGHGDVNVNSETRSVAFWMLPWRQVLIILAILLAVVLVIRFVKKNVHVEMKKRK